MALNEPHSNELICHQDMLLKTNLCQIWHVIRTYWLHPKKYALGCRFLVCCCCLTRVHFSKPFRVTPQTRGQSYDHTNSERQPLRTWWRHQMETFSALLAFCARNLPHKVQWPGVLMFSLIRARVNGWVNNVKAGDLRCHSAHYDVTVMMWTFFIGIKCYHWYWSILRWHKQ